MEVPVFPDSSSDRETFKMPVEVTSSYIDDSGYQSHCSQGSTSFLSDESNLSPCLQTNSMETDEVWQSTPASRLLPVNVHQEFQFVTPVPGPSCHIPGRLSTLEGQRHVDILSLLSQSSILPPLNKILNYLGPVDLCQVRLVSSSWRRLLNNSSHVKMWQQFVRARRQNKENSILTLAKPDERHDLLVTPVTTRGQLRDIHNFAPVSSKQKPRSPPVSPTKLQMTRYLKEGHKLRIGEKLRKCPKCNWPSRSELHKKGVRCTGRQCQFYFCIDCSGPFHEDSPCPKATPVTPTKSRHRVNKLCGKRRLQRLLI